MSAPCNIICLSHLAWDRRLFQRPQQLMTRMARRGHKVLYVGCVGARETLAQSKAEKTQKDESGTPIRVIHVPFPPTGRSANGSRAKDAVKKRISAWRVRRLVEKSAPTVLWLYHPGLLELGISILPRPAAGVEPPVLVYDVMDRFDAFGASEEDRRRIAQRERDLLGRADLVFTGGRTLQSGAAQTLASLQRPHPHCFPSGVDIEHFGSALLPETHIPQEILRLPKPRIGYFGAVDERLDYLLLRRLGNALPAASILLVGPEIGDQASGALLPPNVHFFGARPYSMLPGYLKGFDVALVPFRDSPLVAHVSPTKIPEYLAGGCPVVSSRVPDVTSDWGDIVRVAPDPESFIAAVVDLLQTKPSAEKAVQAARRAYTWEQIAEKMDELIDAAFLEHAERRQ